MVAPMVCDTQRTHVWMLNVAVCAEQYYKDFLSQCLDRCQPLFTAVEPYTQGDKVTVDGVAARIKGNSDTSGKYQIEYKDGQIEEWTPPNGGKLRFTHWLDEGAFVHWFDSSTVSRLETLQG